ncbi:hypothetical protein [Aspergillus creber partitivirus 1]|nr:hypothetical protein [Aspergillus creber partitivirus 1]
MPPKEQNSKPDVEDSASSPAPQDTKGKGSHPNRGKNRNNNSNSGTSSGEPKSSNPQTQMFADGARALQSYGLSVSGRKERILSAFKTDKFFHFVSDSWNALLDAKPHIAQRFSYAEFRHCSALQLYSRLEQVKFDALGIKPAAPTRIPLPRNLSVFQPLWSVLANIGTVEDDELRVTYIPDGILPVSKDLDDDDDLDNLISCLLYDWQKSWTAVQAARKDRKPYVPRTGIITEQSSNELPSEAEIRKQIRDKRSARNFANQGIADGKYTMIDGNMYKVENDKEGRRRSDSDLKKGSAFTSPEQFDEILDRLYQTARAVKERMITPRFDTVPQISDYKISDGTVTADPGAYGAWLHWDPQLWLEYEQFVEEVKPVALFSLSMPVDTNGTYAWLLPAESVNSADVFCKLPKASIPPVTWILALLLQSSTLAFHQRSTFYVETDRLSNVVGIRNRYIRAAIKRGSPTEQYGTY